jgi:hypothetical protein
LTRWPSATPRSMRSSARILRKQTATKRRRIADGARQTASSRVVAAVLPCGPRHAEAALFVALAVAGAAHADPMVCRTEAGVTHCEAPLNHYRVTGTRKGNRTYFEDNKGRRWMMIEEDGRTTVMPR